MFPARLNSGGAGDVDKFRRGTEYEVLAVAAEAL